MKLIRLLPYYYQKSGEVISLQDAFEYWTESLLDAKDDLFLQLFIGTATWGLNLWEEEYGLDADSSKTETFRRERILAKIRGIGTVTKQMIKDVAISFSNGEVEVSEDPANYTFKISFVGTRGIPENMGDLATSIDEIKPAHLSYVFEFTFLPWDEFDLYDKTWNEWDALDLTWDEFESYKEVI